jgi:hypothetical protein
LIGNQFTKLLNKAIDDPFISRELKEDALSCLLNVGKEPSNEEFIRVTINILQQQQNTEALLEYVQQQISHIEQCMWIVSIHHILTGDISLPMLQCFEVILRKLK